MLLNMHQTLWQSRCAVPCRGFLFLLCMDETNGSVCVKGVNYVVIYYKAENIHLLLSQAGGASSILCVVHLFLVILF
jgi:hypothetical protein